jgi:hypothetical protein
LWPNESKHKKNKNVLHIVFSKNRAMQLHMYLKSLNLYCRYKRSSLKLVCLCNFSNEDFLNGYKLLSKRFPNVSFIIESNFKNDILSLIDKNNDCDYIWFAVDDIEYIADFDIDDIIDFLYAKRLRVLSQRSTFQQLLNRFCMQDLHIFSMRYGQNLSQSLQTGLANQLVPTCCFANNFYTYNKIDGEGDWAYCYSLDSHIYLISDMHKYLKYFKFRSPSQLENALQQLNSLKFRTLISFYGESRCFNNPQNKVQSEINNFSLELDADFINKSYLKGSMPILSAIRPNEVQSVHQVVPFTFS